MKECSCDQSQKGFSLVELLIASTLGLMLMGALIEVYLSTKNTLQAQEALSHIQENARYAIYILNQKIRMAGFSNCIDSNSSFRLSGFMGRGVVANTDAILIGACIPFKNKIRFMKTAYYIGNTRRKNQTGNIIFALYRKTIPGRRQELVPNVESMKIQYGIANHYLRAGQVRDWKAVHSVKITLLFNSGSRAIQKKWHTYITLREPQN